MSSSWWWCLCIQTVFEMGKEMWVYRKEREREREWEGERDCDRPRKQEIKCVVKLARFY